MTLKGRMKRYHEDTGNFEPYLGDSHAVPELDVFPVDFRYVDDDNLNLQKYFENDLG